MPNVEDPEGQYMLVKDEEKPKKQVGTLKRYVRQLFKADRNAAFALSAELSLRGAIQIYFAGFPFLFMKGHANDPGFLGAFLQMYDVGIVIFIVYNLAPTTGETIQNCVSALRGVFCAVVARWFMSLVVENGIEDKHFHQSHWPVWLFGWGFGAAFVAFAMMLNFHMSTKIFTVGYFVVWWMNFIKPGHDDFYFPLSEQFAFKTDVGVRTMVTLVFGSVFAILASLLPYPMLALDNAKETSEDITVQTTLVWKRLLDYLGGAEKNTFLQDQVYRQLTIIEASRGTLPGLVANSWWECLGLGRRQMIRRRLLRFDRALQDSCDCIHAVWVTAIRGDADAQEWSDSEKNFMSRVKPEFEEVLDSCRILFELCLGVTCSGILSDQDEAQLKKHIEDLREKERLLTRKFCQVRHQMGRGASALNTEGSTLFESCNHEFLETLRVPHTFGFNLSRFGKVVTDLAEDLVKTKTDATDLPIADMQKGFVSAFEGITDIAQQMWTIRALASVYGAFLVGYFGYGDLFGRYNSGIAGTVAFLLSTYTGSAIVKNLGRLQAVVLGTVAGQMIHGSFSGCDIYHAAGIALCAFVWAFGMFYVQRSCSATYSYIGCLSAAFGITQMLSGKCQHNLLNEDSKVATYNVITTTMMACFLVIVFDVVLPSVPASTGAHDEIKKFFTGVLTALNDHFDKSNTTITREKAVLRGNLDKAAAANLDADMEPRWVATDWQKPLFDRVLILARQIHSDLAGIEICMAEDCKRPGKKNALLSKLLHEAGLPGCGEQLSSRATVVKDLMDIFLWQKEGSWSGLDNIELQKIRQGCEADAVDALVADLQKLEVKTVAVDTLQQEPLCQISVQVACTKAMFRDFTALTHEILRART